MPFATATFALGSHGASTTLRADTTGPPEVEVAYDGCAPPLDLFGHLRALGFVGLVPQPPPSEAIDWTRPNDVGAVTGFTVRPYAAVSRGRLDVPRNERTSALDATRYLLGRLEVTAATTGVTTPDPSRAVTPDASARSAAGAPRGLLGHAGSSPPASVTARASDRVLIEVTVPVEHAAAARPVLGAVGELVGEAPSTWTTTAVYRGQPMETRHHGTGFVVDIDAGDRDQLMTAVAVVPVHTMRELSTAED